jgi:mercuric ion binding protein
MLKLHGFAVLSAAAAIAAQSALAAEKTVVLSVPSMFCPLCTTTVRKALEKVPGGQKVNATFEPSKEAAVTFDDAKTSVEQLLEATKRAGMPATVKPAP